MIDLANKVAVVTGAANGLGKALATELYRQGCHLALLDIDSRGLEKLRSELQNGKQKLTIHTVDISREAAIIETRTVIFQEHQRIDILVNNAGVSISQPFDQLELADYKWLFDVNFWGTVYCSKHFLPDLHQQTDSRLVNIISNFALMGFPGKTTYGSSKSAVMGFTNSLKTELADTAVKISLVIPPPLDTGIVRSGKHIDENKREKEIVFLKSRAMSTDKAAKKIISKVKKGKYRIIISTRMFWLDMASRFFPTAIHWVIGKKKKRIDFV